MWFFSEAVFVHVSRKWKSTISSKDVQSTFVLNLGKPALKLPINWNRPMGSMLYWDHKCSRAIRHFQRAVNTFKMNPTLEDLWLQKRITMWRKCEPLCSQTVDSVRMIASKLNLNHTTVHQILTHELAMRKLCVKTSQKPDNRTVGQSEGRMSSSSGMDPKWQKFFEERVYR